MLFQIRILTSLYGFTVGNQAAGPESYLCSECHREFAADGNYGYDFGEHADAQTWRCFKCNGEVPYERFDCPHCGYRFDPSRRV
jgi:DNA-directed RNA polymerase subunit RPC12/RpoP